MSAISSIDAVRSPHSIGRVFATVLSLPPALKQHPIGAPDVLRFLGLGVFLGFVVYLGTFWVLWIYTRFFKRRSNRTLHRASAVLGLGFALFVPTMYCRYIFPGRIGITIGGVLMVAIWIGAFVIAMRILWKDDVPIAISSARQLKS